MSIFATYPVDAGGSGIAKYANQGSLPVTAADGTVAITLDTDTLWAYSTSLISWVAIGGKTVPLSIVAPANGLTLGGNGLNLRTADSTHTGALTFGDWITFNSKQAPLTIGNFVIGAGAGFNLSGGTGAIIGAGVSLSQDQADATHNGFLNQTDWVTFNNKQSALTIGNITDAGTDGIVITGGTGAVIGTGVSIAQHVADASHSGYLSSTDWNTFNNKGSGTVTAVSVASANGFAGSSSGGATPALTLSTTVTGILQGNGTAISAASTTGSGAIMLAASPATTGTLSAAAISASGAITGSNLSGTNTGDQTITLTGDVTGTGTTSFAATIGNNKVTNAKLDTMPTLTIKGNNTGGTANAADLTVAQVSSMLGLKGPTVTPLLSTGTTTGWVFTISTSSTVAVGDTYTNNGNTYTVLAALSAQTGQVLFTSGASAPTASGNLARGTGSGPNPIAFTAAKALATYTAPTSPAPLSIRVRMIGGGGGGGPSGTAAGSAGANGGSSLFGALLHVANGGTGGGGISTQMGGTGGTASLGAGAIGIAITGAKGDGGQQNANNATTIGTQLKGGAGASTPFGGGGGSGYGIIGADAPANSGAGGGGGGIAAINSGYAGVGGGAGGYVEATIASPAATYVYAVGANAGGGSGGTNGFGGGLSGSGVIIVEEFY